MSWDALWNQVDARIARQLARLRTATRAAVSAWSGDTIGRVSLKALGEQLLDADAYQHYGFRSRPPAGTEAVVVPVGVGGHFLVIAEESRGSAPTDLAAGEVAIYGQAGAKIVLRADGSVEVTGVTININSGVAGAARLGDSASPGAAMTTWLGAASAYLATVGVPALVDAGYTISSASSTVKVGD